MTMTEMLSIFKLATDPDVQRPLDTAWVNEIVRDFDVRLLGLDNATVSRRANGEVIILDGQHRVEAMRERLRRGLEAPTTLQCNVLSGLTVAEEAQIFLGLNRTRTIKWLHKFFVQATAGDPVTLALIALTSKHGWAIAGSTGDGKVTAVGTLARIYLYSERIQADPNLVDVVLEVVTDAWGLKSDATRGPVMDGIARFLGEYGEVIDLNRLRKKLREYPDGPYGLFQQAATISRIRRTRLPMAVADAVTQTYNHGKQKDLLPQWTHRA